jgi:hypothetical protein
MVSLVKMNGNFFCDKTCVISAAETQLCKNGVVVSEIQYGTAVLNAVDSVVLRF